MQSSHIKKLSFVAILSVAFSSLTHSADIARELRSNADKNSVPENFFEIGINAGVGKSVPPDPKSRLADRNASVNVSSDP